MDVFAQFATDEKTELEGTWFPLSSKASLLVARAGNTNFTTALRAELAKNQIDIENGGPEADTLAEVLMAEVMSRTILLGWKGIDYKGVKGVPYDSKLACEMLRLKDFRKKVQGFADTMEAFKVKAETAQGNA